MLEVQEILDKLICKFDKKNTVFQLSIQQRKLAQSVWNLNKVTCKEAIPKHEKLKKNFIILLKLICSHFSL